jgi:hypothetical protein
MDVSLGASVIAKLEFNVVGWFLERSDSMGYSPSLIASMTGRQTHSDVAGARTGITAPKQSATTALVVISAITVFAGLASGVVASSTEHGGRFARLRNGFFTKVFSNTRTGGQTLRHSSTNYGCWRS